MGGLFDEKAYLNCGRQLAVASRKEKRNFGVPMKYLRVKFNFTSFWAFHCLVLIVIN